MNKETKAYANLLYNVAVENAHYLNNAQKEDLKREFKKLANGEPQSLTNLTLDEVNGKLDKVYKAITYNASETNQHITYAKIDCRNDIIKKINEVKNKGTLTNAAVFVGIIAAILSCIFILMKSFDVTIDIENPNPEQKITVEPSK